MNKDFLFELLKTGSVSGNEAELEKKIYHESGQTYALGALPRIFWVKNKMPEIYEKTALCTMFNDWLIYKMTGVFSSEPSNACTTGIYDLEKRDWDDSIAASIGLKTGIFPKTYECGTIVANVSEKGAADTGLAVGTPVVAGGGDCQLGCVGVGVVDPNQAAIFGGSFWQYEYNTNEAKTDEHCRVRVNCHSVPGMWQYEALAFKPGMVMRWYRDAFCTAEKELSKTCGRDPYDLMNEKAKDIPAGCYGMMCTFSDVMNYVSWRHASPSFMNFDFDPDKYNRYTFYRAIMENTAMVTYGHMKLVEESTGNMPDEVIFAGGASKSDLWCQILADVLGKPVSVPVVKEATALGAAIMAGYGVGIYTDISEASRRLARMEKRYEPNSENHKTYMEMYKVWREVYARELQISDDRLTRYMWAAPGV